MRTGLDVLEYELRQEQAATIGRLAQELRDALDGHLWQAEEFRIEFDASHTYPQSPYVRRYKRELGFGSLRLMLQAYFDASTESGNALIFAGYFASSDTWVNFSNDWDNLLTIHPRMDAFKMSAIGHAGMERAMFHYCAIERAQLYGIGCAVPIDPLRKVVAELHLDPVLENPYYLAWRAVITLVLEGTKILGFIDPIEFIFDEQSEQINIVRAWQYFYNTAPMLTRAKILGMPKFKKDDGVAPLQAADMIAWWARRQYVTDKSNMRALFPEYFTKAKALHLLFSELPEEMIREQLRKDIEVAQNKRPRISSHVSIIRGEPWVRPEK